MWRAELTTELDGRLVRAVALEETLHAAIDTIKDEAASQLKKTNTKKTSMVRRAGASEELSKLEEQIATYFEGDPKSVDALAT